MFRSSKHLFFVFFLTLLCCTVLRAQWSIGVTIGGLAVHQHKASNPDLYPWKLDKNGYVVAFSGINLTLSYRINDYLGVKAMQSLVFYDSGGKFAGISHIGLELHDDILGVRWQQHHTSMSLGPFWYYRKNWSSIPGYQNDPAFIRMDDRGIWEQKFICYGGIYSYRYRHGGVNDLAIDLLPGYPHVYAIAAGWNRRW